MIQFRLFTIVLIAVLSFTGCSKKEKPPTETPKLSAVHEKFLTMAREDFGYKDVHVRDVGKTLWIYVPVRERIVDIKASKQGQQKTVDISNKLMVRYVEADLSTDSLKLDYDIQDTKTYHKDPGYGSNYSDEYSQAQQEIMQAISRVYFDFAEELRLASADPENPGDLPGVPTFVVLVVADIEKGVEIESMFYFKDLQKALSMIPSITGDEFMKRYVADIRGSMGAIDDTEGTHLNYRDINMKEFLARQIENRVNFKYTHSITPPSEDTRKEILLCVSEALQAYQYFAVLGVNLNNLATGQTEAVSKDDLKAFIDEHPIKEPKTRLINIRFGL